MMNTPPVMYYTCVVCQQRYIKHPGTCSCGSEGSIYLQDTEIEPIRDFSYNWMSNNLDDEKFYNIIAGR